MNDSTQSNSLRLGIAGLGTVGAALVNVVEGKGEELAQRCGRAITITGINARTKGRARGFDQSAYQWLDDPMDLATSDEIDVFVELMGGEDDPALATCMAALDAGKHVVTANKALLAKHGVALAEKAEANGLLLNYEAAVAGGIPIIKVMRESLTANAVSRVFGILNGTCNYILTRMETDGISFEECLADAQALGFAEADPTFDIEGNDTAHKLAILTSLAFGTQIAPDSIYMEGITKITIADIEAAAELGYRIKLLGVATRTANGVESRVHPAMVPLGSAIAEIGGVTNAVALEADVVGSLMMSGPGAGGDATASAVAGDICDIAKARPGHQHGPALGKPAAQLAPHERSAMSAHAGGYFIRLTVVDKPGTMASITARMAQQDISLESIVQKGGRKSSEAPLIMITHETTEEAIRKALADVASDGRLVGEAQMIRIEKLA